MNRKPSVLMIDDDVQLMELYEFKLREEGFDFLKASNGKDGYDIAKKEKPQLILLDLKMPVMDGIEVLAQLKNDPETKDITVIIFSAFNDYSSVKMNPETAKAMGSLDFIEKNIDLNECIARIKSILARSSEGKK